jgi:aminodeoxyfutalosine deaminase
MAYSLQARVVFPVDRPPIEHGLVTIDGERIVAVSQEAEGETVHDLGDVALLPGLVNAHTHLEFSDLREPLGRPGISLVDWIRLVIAERGRSDQSRESNRLLGMIESRERGVTTIADITTSADTDSYFDIIHFYEVIGFSRARAESAMQCLVDRIGFRQPLRPGIQQGISPHAPYTVSPKLLKELVLRARQHDLPLAMHVAESPDELEFLRDGTGPFRDLLEERSMWDDCAVPRGSRPLDYLRMLCDAPRALVIHGNYLDAEERVFLAEQADRMSLIFCPRTHAYFFHAPYPLSELLVTGVRVALGTDSRASNPDLDLLAEMRHVARTYPTVYPQQIVEMGTRSAAEALGRSYDVGSLSPGKLANLIAVPLPDDARGTPNELLASMLFSDNSPNAIWLRGKRLSA